MSIATLITFIRALNKKSLASLLSELVDEPNEYSVYFNRPKEDWLRRYPTYGDDIHTFLHPQQGNLITTRFIC